MIVTAKALHQVEQLARIVVTFEDDVRHVVRATAFDMQHHVGPVHTSLADTLRDLRLALVDLDIAREGF